MPLTSKGREIKAAMSKSYGEKKGEEVFYASKNKGTITGVDDTKADGPRFGFSNWVGKKVTMVGPVGDGKKGKVVKEKEDGAKIFVKFEDGSSGWYSRYDFRSDDALDNARRSLSYLRDELTKVKAEQRKAKGPEKWTYDDYVAAIQAKIDKMNTLLAHADAEPDFYGTVAKQRERFVRDFEKYLSEYKNGGTRYYTEMLKLGRKLGRMGEIESVRKTDADTTASIVKGKSKKPDACAMTDGQKIRHILHKVDDLGLMARGKRLVRKDARMREVSEKQIKAAQKDPFWIEAAKKAGMNVEDYLIQRANASPGHLRKLQKQEMEI